MSQLILNAQQLDGRLPGNDPFIFAGYLENRYPQGNGALGPEPAMDFSQKDGWSMYHGEAVPGFPAHPHTGFETVTIVRRGLIDHADSLGGSSRYGEGDVQWLTTGAADCGMHRHGPATRSRPARLRCHLQVSSASG